MLASLVIVALVIMFFRVIYAPNRDVNLQLNVQKNNLRMEKEALEQFTQALSQKTLKSEATNTYDRLSMKLEILKGIKKPLTKETSVLLATLTGKPFLRGVVVKEMNDLPVKEEAGLRKAGFSIVAQGSFPNILRYIARMEQLPVLMTIDDVSLKSVSLTSKELELELYGTLLSIGEQGT